MILKGDGILARHRYGRTVAQRMKSSMTQQNHIIEQGEFTSLFCARPQNFAWFLGAGASASAGLPTATDVLWDLKRRYYCREENQDISRQIGRASCRERV